VTEFGRSALIEACRYGYGGIVAALLAKRANVNIMDEYGDTALSMACSGGFTEIVAALLDVEGIRVNARSVYGKTALSAATRKGHSGHASSAPHILPQPSTLLPTLLNHRALVQRIKIYATSEKRRERFANDGGPLLLWECPNGVLRSRRRGGERGRALGGVGRRRRDAGLLPGRHERRIRRPLARAPVWRRGAPLRADAAACCRVALDGGVGG